MPTPVGEEYVKITVPKHLNEITGSKLEQLRTRVRIISDWGPQVWNDLVARSGLGTKQ